MKADALLQYSILLCIKFLKATLDFLRRRNLDLSFDLSIGLWVGVEMMKGTNLMAHMKNDNRNR